MHRLASLFYDFENEPSLSIVGRFPSSADIFFWKPSSFRCGGRKLLVEIKFFEGAEYMAAAAVHFDSPPLKSGHGAACRLQSSGSAFVVLSIVLPYSFRRLSGFQSFQVFRSLLQQTSYVSQCSARAKHDQNLGPTVRTFVLEFPLSFAIGFPE
jgi:hypothetical protein